MNSKSYLVLRYAYEIHEAFRLNATTNHTRGALIWWVFPSAGSTKLNTDGCNRGNLDWLVLEKTATFKIYMILKKICTLTQKKNYSKNTE